jgi:hypothetical protein
MGSTGVTITHKAGKSYVSLRCDVEVKVPSKVVAEKRPKLKYSRPGTTAFANMYGVHRKWVRRLVRGSKPSVHQPKRHPVAILEMQTNSRRLFSCALPVVTLTTRKRMPPKTCEIQRLKRVATKARGGEGAGQPMKRVSLASRQKMLPFWLGVFSSRNAFHRRGKEAPLD